MTIYIIYIYIYIILYIYIFAPGPVSVETSGAMGTDTLRLLQEIAQRIVSRSGEPNAYQRLIQRISVAVQRGNTISIMGTFKPSSSSVSDSSNCSFD